MPIIPWKPFSDLERFFEDDDWLLPVLPRWGAMKPAMDVYETEKDVVAEVSIPDFDPEKVDVSVKDGILIVSGKMDEKKEEQDKGYWRKEIRKGSFERMVRLPAAVKEDAVDATYEKGVLKIVMPKAEVRPTSKKIKIKIKENK
jgi:HSP20 family protein